MQELPKETRIYQITTGFAKKKGIPCYFVARIVKQTEKAVYLYGHGTTETKTLAGIPCCNCGRELTHPVSVQLGIGPECGKHYWNWDMIGGLTEENLPTLKTKLESIIIDTWIPKAVIKNVIDTDEQVELPNEQPEQKKQEITKKAELITYKDSGKKGIKITFPQDSEFKDNLDRVKSLPGRRFHKEQPPFWTCPLSLEAVESLQEWGFELDNGLQDFIDKSKVNAKEVEQIEVPGLNGELMPFQRQGVSFIEAKQGRALIADEMGLGKTIQALAWLQLHPEKRPAVVVCPSSLKLNWEKELNKWMKNPNIQVIQGTDTSIPITGDIVIINYDILPNKYEKRENKAGKKYKVEIPYTGWVDYLTDKLDPAVVIIDECHLIKNRDANRTKGTQKLAGKSNHVIALSGTPIVNRPKEGLNAIKLIDKDNVVVPSTWKYLQRYCGAKHNGFGWDFEGATNTDELHEKLVNSIMIRRKKEDVLTDLPDKLYSHIPMNLDNQKEYNQAEADLISWLKRKKGDEAAEKAEKAEQLARLNNLKQLASKGKMKQAKEWIREFIDGNGKLIVFAIHKELINDLMKEFGDQAVRVDGSVSGKDREKAVEQFQNNDNVRLFIGNIQAAGVGLTLTASSSVAFLELPWTPGELTQAEDRAHRIGQKDSVNVYYLLATGTIEEELAGVIDEKRKTLDSVLDGKDTEEGSLLTELMSLYEAA